MVMENMLLIRLCMKGSGVKGKKKEKEKLYSKVEVYLREILRMIPKKAMEKCIIILRGIIFKENGKMIKRKDKEQ